MRKFAIFLGILGMAFCEVWTAMATPFEVAIGETFASSSFSGGLNLDYPGLDRTFYSAEESTSETLDSSDPNMDPAIASSTDGTVVDSSATARPQGIVQEETITVLGLVDLGLGTPDRVGPAISAYGGEKTASSRLDVAEFMGFSEPSGFEITEKMTSKGSSTPEPATMLLLGIGLLGLAWVGRKKFLNKT